MLQLLLQHIFYSYKLKKNRNMTPNQSRENVGNQRNLVSKSQNFQRPVYSSCTNLIIPSSSPISCLDKRASSCFLARRPRISSLRRAPSIPLYSYASSSLPPRQREGIGATSLGELILLHQKLYQYQCKSGIENKFAGFILFFFNFGIPFFYFSSKKSFFTIF